MPWRHLSIFCLRALHVAELLGRRALQLFSFSSSPSFIFILPAVKTKASKPKRDLQAGLGMVQTVPVLF